MTEKKEIVTKEKSAKKKGRVSKFFRGYKSELGKITWPTFKQVRKNTLITLVFIIIVGAVIWALDFGLNTLRDFILGFAK